MATASRPALGFLANAPRSVPASRVKQDGWKGIMKAVAQSGAVLVTNHDEPQAVIVGIEQFEAMREAFLREDSRKEAVLEELRRSFDERLASLQQEGAGDRLRALSRKPVRLKGAVKAGTGYE